MLASYQLDPLDCGTQPTGCDLDLGQRVWTVQDLNQQPEGLPWPLACEAPRTTLNSRLSRRYPTSQTLHTRPDQNEHDGEQLGKHQKPPATIAHSSTTKSLV